MTQARLIVGAASISLRSSGPATGDIALSLGGIAFPAEDWNDFALVILEAWLSALLRLLRHVSDAERVHFMEGPYAVDLARLKTGAIQVRAVERPNQQRAVVEAMPLALVENAVATAEGVLASCRESGQSSTELERLGAVLAVIRLEVPRLTS